MNHVDDDGEKEVMKSLAHSLLTIRSVSEDQRLIEGFATTPAPDRLGDVVDSVGAKFVLPIPLLWQHQHDMPVGLVEDVRVTDKGIQFRARLATIEESGELKSMVDKAWQAVKAKLVRAVSIGFKSINAEPLDNKGGLRFKEWEWLELSLVTIPANIEATISVVRSISETERAAASGNRRPGLTTQPGAAGRARQKGTKGTMNIQEQIAALEAKRQAHAARMEEILSVSIKESRSTNEEEQEEFDDLEVEVETIDRDLKRLRAVERIKATKAKPIIDVNTPEAASAARSGQEGGEGSGNGGNGGNGTVVLERKLPPGIRFARYFKCMALSQMSRGQLTAGEIAKELYPNDTLVQKTIAMVQKANVLGGSTSHPTWAGPLVGDETSVFADFIEFLRPQTILGKFGTGNIPALRQVPFRTALIGQTSGGTGYWVGEGQPKPLTSFNFSRTHLEPLKVANIAVTTMELLRDSSPSAEAIVRDQLAAALRERTDIDFVSPTKTAVSGVSPASITNGVVAIASSGNDADAVRTDIRALFAAFIAANNPPQTGVLIMPSSTALALSLMMNPLGQPEFPGLSMAGGTLLGLPVITSEYVPHTTTSPATGPYVILVNAGDIYFADDGDVSVDMSTEASLQMLDNPTNSVGTGSPLAPVATSMVSMFQTNSVAFRAERTLNWAKRRAEAVQLLSSVDWAP